MKATRWETLGAWLHLWTPPRDVVIPPPPSPRALLLGTLAALAVVGGILAYAWPRIDEDKATRAAREQRALDARRLARVERARRVQRPRFGEAPAGASRAEVVERLEAAITRDARERLKRGEFTGRVGRTDCERWRRNASMFTCLGHVREIVRGGEYGDETAGRLGYPFRAVVDFEKRRWAFCRVLPPPGEREIPDPRLVVEVPRACRERE